MVRRFMRSLRSLLRGIIPSTARRSTSSMPFLSFNIERFVVRRPSRSPCPGECAASILSLLWKFLFSYLYEGDVRVVACVGCVRCPLHDAHVSARAVSVSGREGREDLLYCCSVATKAG